MADVNTGLFIAALAAKAAGKSKRYKLRPDGTIVFKLHAAVGVYSFIGTLGTAALAFIPDVAGMLLMMAIIGPLFVPFFLYYLFARIYISDEKIVYRNPLGRRREIAWKDLSAVVKLGVIGDIMLYGGGQSIRLYPYFAGFSVIQEKLRHYRPEAFNPDYALSHAEEYRQSENRGRTFRWGRSFMIIGLVIMLYGFAFLLLPNRMFVPAMGSQFMGKFMIALIFIVCGLPFFLLFVNMRLYIDNDMIVYVNLLGIAKQVRWEDVTSYRNIENVRNKYIIIFYGNKKRITISNGFCDYNIIKHIVNGIGKGRRIKFW